MRLHLFLCCCLLAGWPVVSHAETADQFIEQLPSGCINWTNSILTATGTSPDDAKASPQEGGQGDADLLARQAAAENLMHTLWQVRMDAGKFATTIMAADERVSAKVSEMVAAAPVVKEEIGPGGRWSIQVQMPMLGGFAQLMLPEEIRQVQSIKQVGEANGQSKAASTPLPVDVMLANGHYTGLVVDARGIGAKPAMAPLLVDESGREVFGAAFVSREYAVQYGVCEYVRALKDPSRAKRVAPKPLAVKGLRTIPGRYCDIVISNADAARLRDVSENLNFLKQCRVIIIMD